MSLFGNDSQKKPELNTTRELVVKFLTAILKVSNDNSKEGLEFTSEQIAREIEEEIFRQNNYFSGSEEYRERAKKIKDRLSGEENNFIREMLKKGKISVKEFCNLDDRNLVDNNYLKNIGSYDQEKNFENNDLFNFKKDINLNLNNKIFPEENNNSKEKMKKEEEVENEIRDYLKCFICLCKVKNPYMCKFCKKLCCEGCIKKWLENHTFCMKCKKGIKFQDIIKLPFLDDMASYFIHNIDSQPKYKENQEKGNNDKKIEENEENQKVCNIHGNKMEYYCVQCNNYYCTNCLLFFSEEVKKHKGHLIFPESKIKDLGIKEAIHEFNKLPDTKNILDKIINLCKVKIRENEIKKCQISNFIDLIKSLYIKKINEVSDELEKILKKITTQRDSIEASIASIPNGLKNIVDNNDYAQGNIVFQELQKFNKVEENLEDNIKYKSKINPTLFIENYETDFFDFVLPYGFQYQGNMEILNKKLNIIPGFPSRLIIQSLGSQIHTSFSIDIDLPLNDPNYPKFYSYIIVKNDKYGQDFANLTEQSLILEHIQKKNKKREIRRQINSIEFDGINISFLYAKKCQIKLFIIKTFCKS